MQISDFWDDTRSARHDKSRKRINELPIHVPERIILMASNEEDVVLDIFGGGSTYQAAQMHNRFWIGCEIGSVDSCLSRFATMWGKDEEIKLPKKVRRCFKATYIRPLLEEKRINAFYPIQNVEPLRNGHLLNKDLISKSRVIGY